MGNFIVNEVGQMYGGFNCLYATIYPRNIKKNIIIRPLTFTDWK